MPDYSVVPSPSYPTPNYDAFGRTIGGLADNFRRAQQDQNALQQQKMQLEQARAFKNGVPMTPQGTPDYAKILQVQAGAGDPGAIDRYGPVLQGEADRREARIVAQDALGRFELKTPAGDRPPASAAGSYAGPADRSTASPPPRAPGGVAPNISQDGSLVGVPGGANNRPFGSIAGGSTSAVGGNTLSGMISAAVPDPNRAATMSGLLAKGLKVDPSAPLTSEQQERVQRILVGNGYASTARGDYPDTQAGHAAFIRDRAKALGLDPSLPLGIASAEGLRALSAKNPNSASAVDRNPDGTPFSFGDFQLNVRNGLGTEARRAGIDPADPRQWQQADEYALETMAKGGLGPWKGDAAVSAYQAQGGGTRAPGIGGAPASRAIADAAQPRAGGGEPAPRQPLVPQYPLPRGTTPQQVVIGIDRSIAQLAGNPDAALAVSVLQDMRQRIADSTSPIEVTPGRSLVDPATGRTIYTAPIAGGGMSPAAIDAAAQVLLKTGDMPKGIGRGAQGAVDIRAIENRMAEMMAEQGVTPEQLATQRQQYKGQQATIKEFDVGSSSKSVGSFNTLVSHLGTLRDAVAALKNGDTRALNWFRQAWNEQTGDPAPTNFDGVRELVGDELVKAITGGAGALGDREAIKKTINSAASPQQLYSLLDQFRELSVGQLRTLRRRYEAGSGLKDFDKFLDPETRQMFGNGRGAAASGSSGGVTGNLAAGTYRYDPATGKLEAVK